MPCMFSTVELKAIQYPVSLYNEAPRSCFAKLLQTKLNWGNYIYLQKGLILEDALHFPPGSSGTYSSAK